MNWKITYEFDVWRERCKELLSDLENQGLLIEELTSDLETLICDYKKLTRKHIRLLKKYRKLRDFS